MKQKELMRLIEDAARSATEEFVGRTVTTENMDQMSSVVHKKIREVVFEHGGSPSRDLCSVTVTAGDEVGTVDVTMDFGGAIVQVSPRIETEAEIESPSPNLHDIY